MNSDNTEMDNSEMNEELKNWVQETINKNSKGEKKKKFDNKSKKISGKCQICGEKTAKAKCLKCGRNVCLSCHFKLIGICKKCIPRDTVDKWEEKYPDWEKRLGVDWVD